MGEHVLPAEAVFAEQLDSAPSRWTIPPVMEELKARAKSAGLWNLFLPESDYGPGLTNLEYAPLCELMGTSPIAPEAFNCSFPDTGNMEVLVRYGSDAQRKQWLTPLLEGTIRSAFAMTEPDVASSDANNIACRIELDEATDEIVVTGRKWWSSGAMAPECKVAIVMGLSAPDGERHRRHSMVVVPLDTPGVRIERGTHVLGYTDGPHGGHAEILYDGVRVPREHLLGGRN